MQTDIWWPTAALPAQSAELAAAYVEAVVGREKGRGKRMFGAHPNSQGRPASTHLPATRRRTAACPVFGMALSPGFTLTQAGVKNEAKHSEAFTSPFFNDNKKRKESWAPSTSLRTRRFGVASSSSPVFDYSHSFNLDIFSPPSRCPAVKTSDSSNPAKWCDLLAPLILQHCFLLSKLGFLDPKLRLVLITWGELSQIMSSSWCGRAMLHSIFSLTTSLR